MRGGFEIRHVYRRVSITSTSPYEQHLTTIRYHTKNLPSSNQTAGITHAIMAFAKSTLFNSESPKSFEPFEPVSKMRSRFPKDTKVMIALGGWGDTSGFSEGAKTEESRNRYAKNVAAMLKDQDFDGVGTFTI